MIMMFDDEPLHTQAVKDVKWSVNGPADCMNI